jgi:hypothetical protein
MTFCLGRDSLAVVTLDVLDSNLSQCPFSWIDFCMCIYVCAHAARAHVLCVYVCR